MNQRMIQTVKQQVQREIIELKEEKLKFERELKEKFQREFNDEVQRFNEQRNQNLKFSMEETEKV